MKLLNLIILSFVTVSSVFTCALATNAKNSSDALPKLDQIAKKSLSKKEIAKLEKQTEDSLIAAAKRLQVNEQFRSALKSRNEKTITEMLRKEAGYDGDLSIRLGDKDYNIENIGFWVKCTGLSIWDWHPRCEGGLL